MRLTFSRTLALARCRVAPILALLYLAALLAAGFGHQERFGVLAEAGAVVESGRRGPTWHAQIASSEDSHGCAACQWELASVSAGPAAAPHLLTTTRVVGTARTYQRLHLSPSGRIASARAPPSFRRLPSRD